MAMYHLCDICRIRMSKFIVEINDQKGNSMNDNEMDTEVAVPQPAQPERKREGDGSEEKQPS